MDTTTTISITFLKSLLNNDDNAFKFIKAFIQDIDNLSIIIDKNLITQLKNEFETKMYIKTLTTDSVNITIYFQEQYGYVKIITNEQDSFYII